LPIKPPLTGCGGGGSKTQCDNFETVRDTICQLVLITDGKSHTGFRLVPTSVTLFCVISPNSIALQADYVTVVEDRPIMSTEYRLPVIFLQNWLTQQSRGLFATAELLVINDLNHGSSKNGYWNLLMTLRYLVRSQLIGYTVRLQEDLLRYVNRVDKRMAD